MRVGIDGRALTGRFTGDRTYWRGLLGALPNTDEDLEIVLYTRTPIASTELPATGQIRTRVIAAANDRLWSLLALPAALKKDRADLVHVQYTTPPRMLCPCPAVTTVHDISFKLHPEWFRPKDRILLNASVPISMRHAARVITDSESSRRDILAAYRLPEERVEAIPLGLSTGFGSDNIPQVHSPADVLARYGIASPYVLAVGVMQPRKNLAMLCRAFGRAMRTSGLGHALVIAGKAGWATDADSLRALAREAGGDSAANALVFPGYIDDADLPAVYAAADLFAYPSLYEGFGLPPLEAMSCGTPVLVSDAPALPEVVGSAARIVAATDTDAWSAAITEMLTDDTLRQRYRAAGPRRAACFTWTETAKRTRQVYRDVVRD